MSMRDIKICLLGESSVGKSSIVMRFVTDTFRDKLETTVGASFMTKTIIVDDKTFRFQIWDTAGQEKYRALAPMYYRGSAAAIIVYDVTREITFHAMQGWVHELCRYGSSQLVIAIAGNKCDLEDMREVRKQDAQDYADEIGAIFCETSALTAMNIADLFDDIAQKLPPEDLSESVRMSRNSTVKLNNSNSKKRDSCCSRSNSTSSSIRVNNRRRAVPSSDLHGSVSYPS